MEAWNNTNYVALLGTGSSIICGRHLRLRFIGEQEGRHAYVGSSWAKTSRGRDEIGMIRWESDEA